jgi:hypothetical protein
MTGRVCFLVLFTVACQLAMAADIDTRKQVELEKMLLLKGLPATVESLGVQMMDVFEELSANHSLSTQAKAHLKDQIFVLVQEEFAWNKVKPSLLSLYGKHFSLEDIQQINAFYSTSTGKKWLASAAPMDQQLLQLTNQRMEVIIPKVQLLVNELVAEVEQLRTTASLPD